MVWEVGLQLGALLLAARREERVQLFKPADIHTVFCRAPHGGYARPASLSPWVEGSRGIVKPDDTTMRFARLYIPSFPSTPCRFSCIERAWVWQRVKGRPSSLVLVVAKIGAVMLSRFGTVYAECFSPSTTWSAGVASRWPELYILSLFPQAGTSCVSRTSESFATADGGFDEDSTFCRR